MANTKRKGFRKLAEKRNQRQEARKTKKPLAFMDELGNTAIAKLKCRRPSPAQGMKR